jgi:polysaccharide pyruvyl transferase WcaK-like protein
MIGLRCTGKVLEKSDEAVEVINRSEVVIFVGGDYISDTYGLIPLFMHFGNFILVRMYRKKIVFLGHSIGPFRSLLGKIMGFIMLQLVHGIIVRDKQSLSLAKRFGGRRTNVVLLPDLVFLMLNETNSINTRTNRSNLKIGIVTSGTICRLAPRHGLTQAKYLCILEHLANWLSIELNAIVYLIVCSVRGGESDLTPAKRLFSKIQNKENVSIQTCTRPEDAMRIFQELNLLISPRLHPILYALSIPIPVIGIDYNGKVSGAMKMFGLEPYVINLEEIGLHDLCKFVRKALSDNEIIREVIIKRKSDLIDADLYERSVSNVISME